MAGRPPSADLDVIHVLIRALDEKTRILIDEAEKRNNQRFDAQQEAIVAAKDAVAAAMSATDKAVTKAETATEKRFESVNEFRKTLSDQAGSFLLRNEYAVQHQALTEKLDAAIASVAAVEKRVGEMSSRGTGRSDIWSILTTVIVILLALGELLFHFKGN